MNRKTDTGKTLKRWPVFVDHYTPGTGHSPIFVLVYELDTQWGQVYILRVLHAYSTMPRHIRPLSALQPTFSWRRQETRRSEKSKKCTENPHILSAKLHGLKDCYKIKFSVSGAGLSGD